MKYLTNLDLNQNQLLNSVLQNLASAPVSPKAGQPYFNTTQKKAYMYNGTDWVDLTIEQLTGAQIVSLINGSTAIVDDDNLTSAMVDARNKRHSQNTDTGTNSTTFQVGSSGVKVKNASGNLEVRNSGDTGYANATGQNIHAKGTLQADGDVTLGSGANNHTIKSSTTTIKASGKKGDSGADSKNVFEIVDSDTTPNKLFEVRQNGDTVIAGVLTVNGTGESTFAGDVSIGGALNVAQGTTAQADLSGTDLVLTGNLTVKGDTVLGDNATADTTTIKGLTTVYSKTTKALGSSSANAFQVLDSAGSGLLEVKENGDTTIGGVLTVNGTGTSSFAGDVNINGALNVAQDATVNASLSGNDLILTGDLTVNGSTVLGNDASDTLTVVGNVTLPNTTTIGTLSYSQIADAVSKRHSQNTDLGTTSQTFYVGGTSGVRIKNASGELQVRNGADNGYADLRVNRLYVEGTQTSINSNEVNIGDSEILLNSDVTNSTLNSDGGISIKRLKSDNVTRADAKLVFNNTIGRWESVMGDVASTVTATVVNKVSQPIGNGTSTSFTITHNFGTRDIAVSVRETNSPYEVVYTDIEYTTANSITVKFASAPTSSQYTVVITG